MANTKKDLLVLSDIIRNKYQQLKAGQRNESIALETRFKPIVEPLKKLVTIKNERDVMMMKTAPITSPNNNKYTPIKQPNGTPFVKKDSKKRKLLYGDGGGGEGGQEEPVDFLPDSNADVYKESDPESPQAHFQAALSTPASIKSTKTYFTDLYGDIAGKYIFEMIATKGNHVIDKVFGLRYNKDTDQFHIGSEYAKVEKNDLQVKGEWYPGTVGLYELLVLQRPENFTKQDLRNYLSILETTNAHKRNYDALSQIAGNRSYKYLNIIKKHITDQNKMSTHGQGMTLSVLNKKKSELVYWDDPNELVDRLRLLYASQAAGHNNHQNEINSIVEELRESNLIH